MAGRLRQSQVPARDRARAAPRAVGDARRVAGRADGAQRPPPSRLLSQPSATLSPALRSSRVCFMGDYMPELLTIAHVSLTVSDLDRSIPWYERVFDAKLVLDDESGPFRRAVLVVAGKALVGLQEFPDPADNLPFDERRVGLDHLAFACSSRRELEA